MFWPWFSPITFIVSASNMIARNDLRKLRVNDVFNCDRKCDALAEFYNLPHQQHELAGANGVWHYDHSGIIRPAHASATNLPSGYPLIRSQHFAYLISGSCGLRIFAPSANLRAQGNGENGVTGAGNQGAHPVFNETSANSAVATPSSPETINWPTLSRHRPSDEASLPPFCRG